MALTFFLKGYIRMTMVMCEYTALSHCIELFRTQMSDLRLDLLENSISLFNYFIHCVAWGSQPNTDWIVKVG